MRRSGPCRSHLASASIGVEAVVADYDLAFVGNMGGVSDDEFKIIHRLFRQAMSRILISNIPCCLIEKNPHQIQKRQDSEAALVHSPDTGLWGKPTHRIAAVETALNILDDRMEISVLLFETRLIF